MTKRERVLAAFQGKEVDHVPVSMWKHVPSELWGDDNQFAEYQVKFAKDTDVDFIKLSADNIRKEGVKIGIEAVQVEF